MDEITKELLEALKTIESWSSHTTAYAVDFGSNGVRDFYRAIARQSNAKAEATLAATQPSADAVLEPAPANSLPAWSECAIRVGNSKTIEQRVKEGGYGNEYNAPVASQLHRFIYEYDDDDPYRSAWFMHRLELLIQEIKAEAAFASPQPADDGWIPWAGGECPVGSEVVVTARFRFGGQITSPAKALRWFHAYDEGDIIAYRVVKP